MRKTHFIGLALVAVLGLSGCATRTSFAGIAFNDPLQPRSDIQSLALRASSGDKNAQLALGMAYETGNGVPVDLKRARRLYRMAATTTGGTIFVYVPGPKGKAGYVTPVNTGPVVPGLAEAKLRLKGLKGKE